MNNNIDAIMKTTMENLKEMVDVNTVVGTAVMSRDGTTIIPVSRVSFGFVAGGGEYSLNTSGKGETPQTLPFAGGAGAGVSVAPVGFLVVEDQGVRMLSAHVPSSVDRMIEAIPSFIGEIKKTVKCIMNQDEPTTLPSDEKPQDGEKYVI
ncbi:MAG: GerW family sporulation protein [Christensenellales bacterium]|jgi:sporulation protein YtfJ